MAKGNVFLIKRRGPDHFTRTLVSRSSVDADGKPLEFPFVLRKLPRLQGLGGLDKGHELAARYVDGNELLPPIDGHAVIVSRSACFIVGTLLVAQAGGPEESYRDEEMFAMMADDQPGWEPDPSPDDPHRMRRLPSLFDQICELADEVAPEDGPPVTDPLASGSDPSSSTPH